jgi:hypothetical protein
VNAHVNGIVARVVDKPVLGANTAFYDSNVNVLLSGTQESSVTVVDGGTIYLNMNRVDNLRFGNIDKVENIEVPDGTRLGLNVGANVVVTVKAGDGSRVRLIDDNDNILGEMGGNAAEPVPAPEVVAVAGPVKKEENEKINENENENEDEHENEDKDDDKSSDLSSLSSSSSNTGRQRRKQKRKRSSSTDSSTDDSSDSSDDNDNDRDDSNGDPRERYMWVMGKRLGEGPVMVPVNSKEKGQEVEVMEPRKRVKLDDDDKSAWRAYSNALARNEEAYDAQVSDLKAHGMKKEDAIPIGLDEGDVKE